MEGKKLKILIACLNWGVGHASRSVPIVNFWINSGHDVFVVSDGRALNFLRKETNATEYVRIKDVKIRYSNSKLGMFFSLINSGLKIKKIRRKEHLNLKMLHYKERFDLVISDNRYGLFLPDVYSILLTHQLNPIAPFGRFFTRNILANWTSKFNEVWIPDFENKALTHSISDGYHSNIKFVEPLSRLTKQSKRSISFDYLFVLSGPEPSRTLFEELIIKQSQNLNLKIALVRGVNTPIEGNTCNHLSVFNLIQNSELEELISASEKVICRGGFSTIMDMVHLNIPAFLVPTPGQWEQEYLCEELKKIGVFNSCSQNEFNLKELSFFDPPNLKIEGIITSELTRLEAKLLKV